jgi:hypothetical protein
MLANPSNIKVNPDHLDNNILDTPLFQNISFPNIAGFFPFLWDSFPFHEFLILYSFLLEEFLGNLKE